MQTEQRLSGRLAVHGTLITEGEEGILFLGGAGSGKSSTALHYIAEGNKLVADDVVLIERIGANLLGRSPTLLEGMLSIPDLGIFDVRDVFGKHSFVASSLISRCVEFVSQIETPIGNVFIEFFGIKLPKACRNVRMSSRRLSSQCGIDLSSLRQSESRFLQRHARIVGKAVPK